MGAAKTTRTGSFRAARRGATWPDHVVLGEKPAHERGPSLVYAWRHRGGRPELDPALHVPDQRHGPLEGPVPPLQGRRLPVRIISPGRFREPESRLYRPAPIRGGTTTEGDPREGQYVSSSRPSTWPNSLRLRVIRGSRWRSAIAAMRASATPMGFPPARREP